MLRIWVTALLFATSISGQAQVGAITLIVSVPQADTSRHDVFVAGSFNYWHAGDTLYRMKPDGPGRYRIVIPVFADRIYEYKYTLGSWNEVEVAANDSNISNRRVAAGDRVSVSDTVQAWRRPAKAAANPQEERLQQLKDSAVERLKPELGNLMGLLKRGIENSLQDQPDTALANSLRVQARVPLGRIFDELAGLLRTAIQSLSPAQKQELRKKLQTATGNEDFLNQFEKGWHEVTSQKMPPPSK